MRMWDFLICGNFIFIRETVWSLFHSLYIWLICVQCCFGSLLVEGTPAEDGCCRMCILHCGISYNCNPCTSGAHSKFCTRNLDLGNTTRYIQMCACLEFRPPFFFLSIFDVICDWLFIFLRLLIVFPFRFSFNSLSNICCSFTFNSAGLYFALWTSLWADKYTNLLGNLFFNGFTYGKILFLFLNFFYQNVIYYILYYVIKFLWHLNFTM